MRQDGYLFREDLLRFNKFKLSTVFKEDFLDYDLLEKIKNA